MPREEKINFNAFKALRSPKIHFVHLQNLCDANSIWDYKLYFSAFFLQEITNDLQENAKFLREMQQDSTEIQQYRPVVNDVTCRWWNNNFYYLTDSRSQIMSDYYRLFTQVTERHSFFTSC